MSESMPSHYRERQEGTKHAVENLEFKTESSIFLRTKGLDSASFLTYLPNSPLSHFI